MTARSKAVTNMKCRIKVVKPNAAEDIHVGNVISCEILTEKCERTN